MPKKPVVDAQTSFAGGLNLSADITQLRPNEVRRATNARLTEYGGILKRGGTQRIHASALSASNPVRGGYGWVHGSTVQQLAICNGQLFTATYGIPTTFTGRSGTFSSTEYPSFAGFRDGSADVCYIADGGLLNSWDGATVLTNIAGTPSVSRIVVYNLRLFGISGTDSTVYWSALGDGDTLGNVGSGGGSAIVRTYAQQDLIGLLPLGASLMMIHKNGISRFTGWSQDDIDIDSGASGVSADTGTIAPNSLVAVENVGFMVSDRGVYQITELGVSPIGQKIESMIRDLDQSTFTRIQAAHHKARNEVHFYFPDVGVYSYNYRLQEWTGPFDGTYISPVTHSMWQTVDSSARPIVLFGGADGFVRQIDAPSVYKDDVLSDGTGGSSFALSFQCHRMFFGEEEMEKALRFLYITANSVAGQSASVRWTMESGTAQDDLPVGTSVAWGTGTWNPSLTWPNFHTQPRRIQAWGSGTFLDVSVTDNSNAAVVYSRVRADGFAHARRF